MDTPTMLSDIGNAAANGQNPANHPGNQVQTQAFNLATMLSSVPLFGTSGQCPSDFNFSHQGHSFALPFSTWCPYLQMIGFAFMAACYLSAGFIVFRKG